MESPKDVVDELFESAVSCSKARFLLSLIDMERMQHENINYIAFGSERNFALYEFVNFFKHVDRLSSSPGIGTPSFVRKLNLLAYSQFWECAAIQRILLNRVKTCCQETYDFAIYTKERPSTYLIMKSIGEKAKSARLKLSTFLEENDSNQLRNAFVHSEYLLFDKGISLLNHDHTKIFSKPSIMFSDWDRIYESTREFIKCFLGRRNQELHNYGQIAPIDVNIPELGLKKLTYDAQRGFWGGHN
jgi:hypothetical protein